jgi:hypothetical protein
MWLAVIVVASRARSPFGRRRAEVLTDETLIDLDELPPPAVQPGIAGEVLAGLSWTSHQPEPDGRFDIEDEQALDELAGPQ